jgi:hypothetical protein
MVWLLVVWLLVGSGTRPVGACVCPIIEPDAAYRQALLVFTGTVNSVTEVNSPVEHDEKPLPISQSHVTRMTVDEYFKGTGGAEIDLIGGNTSCDIDFEPGKRYLVYATQSGTSGALGAFSCSRTSLVGDYVKPDISYLRRVSRGEQPTMLYGCAFRSARTYSNPGAQVPLSGITVTVEGQGTRLDLKTDESGYFETFELPPGSYRVHTSVTGKQRGADARAVELRGGGVASVMFHTTSMGSLRGRLVDENGNPVKELHVEMLAAGGVSGAGAVKDYVQTGENGEFVFAELPSGRYVLAVNSAGRPSLYGAPFLPSYFPNAASLSDAQPITIEDGVQVDLSDFVLQRRYPTVAVSGTVVTSEGEPVPGAFVNLEKSGRPWDAARPVQTDAAGQFVHRAFEGVTYNLRASADGPDSTMLESDILEITAAKSAAPVRLVVKRRR